MTELEYAGSKLFFFHLCTTISLLAPPCDHFKTAGETREMFSALDVNVMMLFHVSSAGIKTSQGSNSEVSEFSFSIVILLNSN